MSVQEGEEIYSGIKFAEDRVLDVIGLGRLCIDLNANEINRSLEETATFTKYVGGSPANIAIAMARAGLKVGFVGKLADDAFGRYIRHYLVREGIDADGLSVDRTGAVTGLAFTEIKSAAECSLLMYRDNVADLKLEPGEVREAYIAKAKALLISGTALAASPSREAVLQAVDWARKHGVVLIMDIDYRPYTWGSRHEAYAYCRLVAAQCDILLGGREEFDLIEGEAAEGGTDDDTAAAWLRETAKLVVIKHGANGATAYTKDGAKLASGIYPAQVIKTFGAGDSFAGAFICGLLRNWELKRCMQYGTAAAHIVVSSHSCSDAMPTLEQMSQIIRRFEGEEACLQD